MRRVLVAASALALASCGSGDGSVIGSTGAVPITPGATPTPIPTPSSEPTPTPTPSLAPTAYEAAFDFTRDRSFSGVVTASTTQTFPAQVVYGDGESGTIAYTAASQGLTAFGTTIVPNEMGASVARTDASLVYSYLFATSGVTLGIYRAATDVIYVTYLRQDALVKPISFTRFALIGAPTLAADLPPVAASTYRLTVGQIGTQTSGQTLVVDWPSRRIEGNVSITLAASEASASVAFQGIVNAATGRLDGTARASDGTYTGAFHGRLYGPAGAEIGLIFNLKDSDGKDVPGVIVGRAG